VLVSGAAFASNVVRVQAEAGARLPARAPGGPSPPSPTAAEAKALRQRAIDAAIDRAVLDYARGLAREDVRNDEAALRAALGGNLAPLTLGHGVIADLGEREALPRLPSGAYAPRPVRKPGEAVPMEHAWRIEALVDGDRVLAGLRAAGVAVAAGDGASGPPLRVTLLAPYDAAGLAALRAHLLALGAASVVPRRFTADEIALEVRGLAADVLARRLEVDPPTGFAAQAEVEAGEVPALRVRLTPRAAG
jgi:hypothetical protein